MMSCVQAREVYSKELKGSISAIASLQGHLLIAIGPKIILHSWNGSELNGAAFFDAPLYVVSLNIVSVCSSNHSIFLLEYTWKFNYQPCFPSLRILYRLSDVEGVKNLGYFTHIWVLFNCPGEKLHFIWRYT